MVLTKLNEKSIAVLIETRSSIGVHKDNGDVFAVQTSNSLNHIRGCDALRDQSCYEMPRGNYIE